MSAFNIKIQNCVHMYMHACDYITSYFVLLNCHGNQARMPFRSKIAKYNPKRISNKSRNTSVELVITPVHRSSCDCYKQNAYGMASTGYS